MVEFADEMEGSVEGEDVAMSVVADIHRMPTERAVTVEDVKL